MPEPYPPDRHLLRDLRLSFDHGLGVSDNTSRAWLPVVPEVCTSDGSLRAGALATLVDVIGGGLAAKAAHPDWIATADLTLHLVGAATHGSVEARAHVVHAGRTTVVIEVELRDDAGTEIGAATMSFARLQRRDTNPDITAQIASEQTERTTMALADSRLRSSLLDELEVRVIDAEGGELEAPIGEWSRNSLGSMQGGVVATIVDAAAEVAARAATGDELVVADIQLTYLALARVGPVRSRVEIESSTPGVVAVRVELVDEGTESPDYERRPGRRDAIIARCRVTGAGPASAAHDYYGPDAGRDVPAYVRVGLREVEPSADGAPRVEGNAPAAAHLRGPGGGVRGGALLTMLDNVGGLCGGLAALPDGWVVTTNLSARTIRLSHVGPFRIAARVLRKGRSSVVAAVEIRDEGAGDALVVDGVLTSAILVPENGPPEWTRPLMLPAREPQAESPPPIPEWLGAVPIDAATMEMPLQEALRNPWGILHGGAVASLIDLAAEHVAAQDAGESVTTDVVLHFLAPIRIGPVRAHARVIGSRADGKVLRVEVRDDGADRVTALAIVTSTPVTAPPR